MLRLGACVTILSLSLAACERGVDDPAAEANSASTEIIAIETHQGMVTHFEMGDYLWVTIQVPDRAPITALAGDPPVDLFLNEHRGQALTLEVATVRMFVPEAGSWQEMRRIVSARSSVSAQQWWAGLSALERQAAQTRFEQGPLSGRDEPSS